MNSANRKLVLAAKHAKEKQFRELMALFEMFDEAFEPFKSGHKMPGANAGDCRVLFGNGPKGQPEFKFQFLAKGNNIVELTIDVKSLCADPDQYISNTLEALNQGMMQAALEHRIIVPTAVSQKSREAIH